jgi:hypothetical protein
MEQEIDKPPLENAPWTGVYSNHFNKKVLSGGSALLVLAELQTQRTWWKVDTFSIFINETYFRTPYLGPRGVLSHAVGFIEYPKAFRQLDMKEVVRHPHRKLAVVIKRGLEEFVEGRREAFPEYREDEERHMRFVYEGSKNHMRAK